MEYSDIIIEGVPSKSDIHSPPALPEDYRHAYISCIPRIPVPNGRFVFYMRSERAVIERLASDIRVAEAVLARSWGELFFGTYRHWDWVFDAEVHAEIEMGTARIRRKIAQLGDQEILGIHVPGIFSGDTTPQLSAPRFLVDRYTRLRDDIDPIRPIVTAISDELIRHVANRPENLHQLSPRKFEELICAILCHHGWDVTLTPPSKDGGYDIIGFSGIAAGVRTHWLIECKRWAPERKVGVEIVRALCGVKESIKSANAMIVTTSSFTRGARELAHSRWDLDLRDYEAVMDWIRGIRPG